MKTIILACSLLLTGVSCAQQQKTNKKAENLPETATAKPTIMKNIYDFKVKDINGNEFDFSSLKGKKIMIVNTASECGLTPQYENLEKLNKQYGGKDFVIIGFPCNDFGAQEPGSNDEIKTFCSKNYGVTFKLMDKVSVVGDSKCELYQWLTTKEGNGVESTDVRWNFQKYLIDENGNYVKMLSPKVLPDDKEVIDWITN